MNNYVNFKDLVYKDWFVESAPTLAGMEYEGQETFGHVIEKNLLAGLANFPSNDKFKFNPTSHKEDLRFGADGHVVFRSPGYPEQDGMSCYIDVTTNVAKDKVKWFKQCTYTFNTEAHEATPYCQLEMGSELCFGIKESHSNFFYYKKPVIVIGLKRKDIRDIRFSDKDIDKISYLLRMLCKHISFHYYHDGGKGFGKSASKQVIPNPYFFETEKTN